MFLDNVLSWVVEADSFFKIANFCDFPFACQAPSVNGSTLNGKNLLYLRANSFL